ncbi:MAG: hypothetical protein AAF228_09390 [Pseudomonadota bacterium]
MLPLPTEDELKNYLRNVKSLDRLPYWAELEPGSFFYVAKEIWEREQERDGRRGHMTETAIAKKISQIIGRKFTRNQYQSLFGAGRKTQKSKPGIKRDLAEAFLTVAFENWSFGHVDVSDENHGGFKSIFPGKEAGLKCLITEVCNKLYKSQDMLQCIAAPGLGPNGFYRKCRKNDQTVIVASETVHILMDDDPAQGFIDWLKNISIFFRSIATDQSSRLHIWVLREPVITNDSRCLKTFYDIGLLKTAFRIGRAIGLTENRFPQWEHLLRSCVIVLFREKSNDKYRPQKSDVIADEGNPISEYFIFPRDIPSSWKLKNGTGTTMNGFNALVTIKNLPSGMNDIKYNTFRERGIYESPPIFEKPSPSKGSDQSFKNLYLASSEYVNPNKSKSSNSLLDAAQKHGWKFMTIEEFFELKIP